MKISLSGWFSSARVRTVCLPVLLLFVITGCSSFERQYEAALASSPSVDSPEGAWVGNWKSNLKYTTFWGNKNEHRNHDRDNISFDITYTF